MFIQRVSVQPVKSGLTSSTICQNSEKFTNSDNLNDSFTCQKNNLSFKGHVGGAFGLGLGGLLALVAASATGVGIPAAIAMLAAGETAGAAAGSKIGDAIGGDDDD